jgi:transcription termination/antitermination protein NusG
MHLDLPLFPGYVFTRISISRRLEVLNSPGAVRFVSCGVDPVVIPDVEIDGLRFGLATCPAEPHPFLHSGDQVLVRRGPFEGAVGILVRQKNDYRVVISVNAIARSIVVELDLADLDTLPIKPGLGQRASGRQAN